MRSHHLRDAVFFSALLVVCALFAHGQSFGPYTITSTGCTNALDVSQKATVAFQVTGSWSGTIRPKLSIAGQALVNATVLPAASTMPAATLTANGGYISPVSGASSFSLCGATVTGTAKIYLNLSTAPH